MTAKPPINQNCTSTYSCQNLDIAIDKMTLVPPTNEASLILFEAEAPSDLYTFPATFTLKNVTGNLTVPFVDRAKWRYTPTSQASRQTVYALFFTSELSSGLAAGYGALSINDYISFAMAQHFTLSTPISCAAGSNLVLNTDESSTDVLWTYSSISRLAFQFGAEDLYVGANPTGGYISLSSDTTTLFTETLSVTPSDFYAPDCSTLSSSIVLMLAPFVTEGLTHQELSKFIQPHPLFTETHYDPAGLQCVVTLTQNRAQVKYTQRGVSLAGKIFGFNRTGSLLIFFPGTKWTAGIQLGEFGEIGQEPISATFSVRTPGYSEKGEASASRLEFCWRIDGRQHALIYKEKVIASGIVHTSAYPFWALGLYKQGTTLLYQDGTKQYYTVGSFYLKP